MVVWSCRTLNTAREIWLTKPALTEVLYVDTVTNWKAFQDHDTWPWHLAHDMPLLLLQTTPDEYWGYSYSGCVDLRHFCRTTSVEVGCSRMFKQHVRLWYSRPVSATYYNTSDCSDEMCLVFSHPFLMTETEIPKFLLCSLNQRRDDGECLI